MQIAAQRSFPHDVAVDAAGRLYVSDAYHHRVTRHRLLGGGGGGDAPDVVAGGRGRGDAPDQLHMPQGIDVVDADAAEGAAGAAAPGVYVADRRNHRVMRWAPGAACGAVAAGGHGAGNGAHQLDSPGGVSVCRATGAVLVAEWDRVSRWPRDYDPAAGAGAGAGVVVVRTPAPGGVRVFGADLYVCEPARQRVALWRLPPAGEGDGDGDGDGVAAGEGETVAEGFAAPLGLWVDPATRAAWVCEPDRVWRCAGAGQPRVAVANPQGGKATGVVVWGGAMLVVAAVHHVAVELLPDPHAAAP